MISPRWKVDDESALESARNESMAASLVCQKAALEVEKVKIVERLGKPARDYQQYLRELKLWMDREKELRGDDQNPDAETLNGLERELNNVNSVYPETLREAREERQRIAKELFKKKRGMTQFYNSVKRSIDAEIAKCREELGEYDITIEAGLRFNPSFTDEFSAVYPSGGGRQFPRTGRRPHHAAPLHRSGCGLGG